MTRTSKLDLQHLKPSRASDEPIYQQLYQSFREAIVTGKLRPGERVPSVRSLASELGLARGTIELAYQLLAGEGYFQSRGAAGTVVSPSLGRVKASGASLAAGCSPEPSSHRPAIHEVSKPFQLGLPALDAFPRTTWVRLACRTLRALDVTAMNHPNAGGYEPLRRAIASYLGISRSINCSHEQVFITSGYRGGLELVSRTLLRHGDMGWHENPGYLHARDLLQRMGMRLAPIPVDDEGMNVTVAQQGSAEARFAVVTATHQFPTGVALSLPRRLELLEWAKRQRAWVIEDDYDSEFRYRGRPLPALKSLDQNNRVLYCGTFSKVLFPGLRLGYVVVPEPLISRFRDTAENLPGPGSILPQATVAEFMERGHFARHLRKMRSLYSDRRSYLAEALKQRFDCLDIISEACGTHLLARLTDHRSDKAVASAAQSCGLAVQALSDWCVGPDQPGGLLLGFTNITGPDSANMLTQQLWEATRNA
ncbi:PLP-dependent aminotransferase family protein [Xanthomonas axonopodis]|uniref:MocR-like pyridoxine biosynthesis transcription factor PdxR n=1 Tax=Xanthomonas axonopodis TaxID=53413 RepID=UPI0035573A0E